MLFRSHEVLDPSERSVAQLMASAVQVVEASNESLVMGAPQHLEANGGQERALKATREALAEPDLQDSSDDQGRDEDGIAT